MQREKEIDALVQAGHLVKVPITVSDLSSNQVVAIHQRLRQKLKGSEGYWIVMFLRQSNTVVVVCRPDQARACRSTVEEIGHISSAEPDVSANRR